MTTEHEVRTGLAALAERVRPAPDPFARLMARRRRARIRRIAASGVASTCVVALGVVLAVVRPTFDAPVASPTDAAVWTQRLLDAGPRGSVGTDSRFTAELTSRVTGQYRASETDPKLPGNRTLRVLFVEDIGEVRVAALALMPSGDDLARVLSDTVVVWLVAPRGSSADALASAVRRGTKPTDTGWQASRPSPFMVEELPLPPTTRVPSPMAVVGLAPPGCDVSTAPLPELTEWRAETTGSYIVREPAQRRAEWWRVTCAGVVRAQEPARPVVPQITESDMAEALSSARGTPDPLLARQAVTALAGVAGYTVTARPSVIRGDELADFPPSGARVVLVAAPAVGGGWACTVIVALNDMQFPSYVGMFTTPTDPADPSTLLAVRLEPASEAGLLVLAPAGAVGIRAVVNAQMLDQAVSSGGAAILAADQPGVRVEAYTAGGHVVARTVPVGPSLGPAPTVSNWG